ncbi:hypothetical protein OSL32_25250, partial [Escherichia coli]|nr:hypothetical protein [Escherichia coli]
MHKPIVRSVSNVVVLIDSLYAMLRTTPFHRESYSLLIIQTIVGYHHQCSDRFRDLVSKYDASHPGEGASASTHVASTVLSAVWAQR